MDMETLLEATVVVLVVAFIVTRFLKGSEDGCNQDCKQGRCCNCKK